MSTQIKRMNWTRTRTAWEQHQAWQKQRAVNRQIYEQNKSAAIASFGNAFTNQIQGVGELAVKQAAKRIETAMAAKSAELQKQLNELV
jgi:hypothetical protein